MSIPREELVDSFVQLFEAIYAGMCPSPTNEWWGMEFTMPQLKALVLLYQGPHRMSDIASYLGTSLSSATSMMDRLVEKDLIDRAPDPDARRVVTCRLTSHGRAEMERFWSVGRTRTLELAEDLTDDELQVLIPAMEIFRRAAQRDQDRIDMATAEARL